MRLLLAPLAFLLHAAMILAVAPVLAGLVETCRARLLGRRGPPLLQPVFDLLKLIRKTTLAPDNASELYQVWPLLGLGATVAAALSAPGFCFGMAAPGGGDAITLIGLLALAHAAEWLGGMEGGSSVGGAAVARLSWSGVVAGAAWLPTVLCLALPAGDATLTGIGRDLRGSGPGAAAALALAALLVLALAETGRGPLGAPMSATTSGAEAALPDALTREYSGRFLALWRYAAMLRLALWLSLLGAWLFPYGVAEAASLASWPGGIALWIVKMLALAAVLAGLEAWTVRLRPARRPAVLASAALLALLAAVVLLAARPAGVA